MDLTLWTIPDWVPEKSESEDAHHLSLTFDGSHVM